MMLSPSSRYAVAFGDPAPCALVASEGLGGAAPSKVLVFPAGRWVLADGELLTDEEAFRLTTENFRARGIRVVFDYEHMTLEEFRKPGELPIAAGFITALEVTKQGLVGSVIWTEKAAQMIAAGEYLYHSPVAIYDKATLRVIALHSCALTNTPRTNNQQPITEQVAARIIAACYGEPGGSKGGDGMQWIDLLMQFLSGRYDSTPAQKIEMLRALIAALEAVETAEGTLTASETAETLLQRLGLVRASEVVAASEVVTALGLSPGVELPAVVARIAEHDAVLAALRVELETERRTVASLNAQLENASRGNEIETLIATHSELLSPALRTDLRTVAKTNHALAVQMIANITGGRSAAAAALPRPIAGEDPNVQPSLAEAGRREWRGEMLEVSEGSGATAAAVRAIQKAEGCDYLEASRRFHQRNRAA
jgi:phage I-like protein